MGTENDKIIHWLDWTSLALLTLLAPLYIFPKAGLLWVLAVPPLFLSVRGVLCKRFRQHTITPMDFPMLVMVLAIVASIATTSDLNHSLSKIAGLIFGISMFYALVNLLRQERLLKWAVALFFAGSFAFSIVGLLGMPTFKVKHLDFLMKIKDMLPRIHFNLPGAESGFSTNAIGGTLLLAIPLFWVLLLLAWNKKTRAQSPYGFVASLLIAGGLMLTGGVLLLTQSRGAWIGLLVASAILGVMKLRRHIKSKRTLVIVVSLLLIACIMAGFGLYSFIQTKGLSPGLKQAEGTLQFRIHVWNICVPLIREHALWGVGLNNFRLQHEIRYFWSSAHNQFLHVAVEMGIPALVAYLALLIIAAYMCLYVRKHSKTGWLRATATGLGWGQLAFLFFGITDAIPLGAKVGVFFWLSLALIAAIYKYVNNNLDTDILQKPNGLNK